MRKFLIIISIFTLIVFFILSSKEENKKVNKFRDIQIASTTIKVEIVDTTASRTKGLSDRKVLEEGSGMLFVFENPGQYGFWMKNMNFPIDIVWISLDLKVVDIEKGLAPETFPNVFYPPEPVKYVLELPVGNSEKFGIDIGSVVFLGVGN